MFYVVFFTSNQINSMLISIWATFTLCVNGRGSKGHIFSEPCVPLSFTN